MSALPSSLVALPVLINSVSFIGEACNLTWVVPENVHRIQARMWGAGGGSKAEFLGGRGAYVQGSAFVTPGETLWLTAGSSGAAGTSMSSCGGGAPGVCMISYYGTYFYRTGASGGGSSSISRLNAATGAFNVIAVAGGGGGASEKERCLPGLEGRTCGAFSPTG